MRWSVAGQVPAETGSSGTGSVCIGFESVSGFTSVQQFHLLSTRWRHVTLICGFRARFCVVLTDVLLPVAGDPAVDLLGPVLTGGLPQAVSTVPVFRDTSPIPGLCRGALGGGSRLLLLPTCRAHKHQV